MAKHSTQGSVVIHRIRKGKDGRDAGSYYLTVSPTEFSLDRDGNVKGDGTVKIQAWLSVAAGTPAKAADSDIYLVVKGYKTDGTESSILAKQQAAYEFDVKTYSSCRTFVITLYDGLAKTNQWDSVTVIVGAQDAKDAIRVDLENENDSLLYQGDGTTLVNGENQFLTSQAHLYDGYTKDPTGVVWSIDSKTEGCDATITNKGLVRVNGVTALLNEIKVKAVYKGGSYYATMTVKKLVGVDKYELWLSEVAVGYNTTTKSATATSITIRVYKTAQNGTRTNISTLPTGMTISGSSDLSRAYSGGYATMPVDTSKAENYVVLKQGTQELDRETIPILSFVNGQNVIRLDLDNENDSVLYQGDGSTLVGSKPQSTWYLYDGITDVSSQVDTANVSIESTSTGVTASFVENTNKRTIKIDGIDSTSGGSGEVIVLVKYKEQNYRARMTVKRLVGIDKYELEVSPNSVGFNSTTGTSTGSTITIRVWKTAQNGTRTNISTLPTGYQLKVNGTNYASSYASKKYSFTAESTVNNYVIVLTDGTNDLDTETVPVLKVANGGVGDSAKYITVKGACMNANAQNPNHGSVTVCNGKTTTTIVESDCTADASTGSRRGLALVTVKKSDLSFGTKQFYDTYSDDARRNALATAINAVSNDYFICLFSYDAVGWNADLVSALKNVGSRGVENQTTGRYPFAFIGCKGLPQGYAFQMQGTLQQDTTVDVTAYVADGALTATKDGDKGENAVSYVLDVQTCTITYGSDGTITSDSIAGYAYRYENGSYTAVDLSASDNYVSIRYNGNQSSKITYISTSAGRFQDMLNLKDKKLTSQYVYIELYVGSQKVAQQAMLQMLPGADGYNYLPMNNGPYDSTKEYKWDIEKRDFVDVEEDGEWNRYGVKSFGMTVPTNTPPPNSSYWTYVQQKMSTLIANTVFGTNANIGGFLVSSNRFLSSQVAYYVRNRGTYSSSTTYYYNTTAMNAPRIDLVLYNENYYVPKAAGSLVGTTPTNTTYWRLATSEEIKASEVSSGSYITLYKIELNGIEGIIRVMHADGYRWEVQKDGVQILGNDAGRHIEFDPANREIRLYNDSGELSVRMDGATETGVSTVFGTDSNNTFSMSQVSKAKSDPLTVQGSASGRKNQTSRTVIGNLTTNSAGRIRIRGTMYAYATYTYAGSQWDNSWYQLIDNYWRVPEKVYPGSNDYYWSDVMVAHLFVITYDSSSKNYQKGNAKFLGYATAYGGNKWYEYAVVGDTVVEAGYHELVIEYEVHLAANNYAYGKLAWSFNSYSFTADYYLSRIFANGLAFGSSINNAFAVVRNSAGNAEMRFATNNAKYGFEVLPSQTSKIVEQKLLKETVTLGFCRVHCYQQSNGNQTASINDSRNALRDGGSFSVERLAQGKWKVTYPTTWASLGFSKEDLFITVVAKSNTNGYLRFASIAETNKAYCYVHTGDDDSPNDEIDFWIKIDYMLP